ncbi:ras-related protein RIC1-like [Iris pallida]|uniref:Ras-related protein RIC1-like n=1 Tax=Iris pallida TaxID=29817 RepID=A0AAX6H4J2_IRIPA|nr:ras-related protein RIC1-like [Iris pallida]KAJ6807870.1 ras-related protein RIC1-like [Iris pallida]KAJ6835723.1 ras-related protein RIC1-like [Iris pallida]
MMDKLVKIEDAFQNFLGGFAVVIFSRSFSHQVTRCLSMVRGGSKCMQPYRSYIR